MCTGTLMRAFVCGSLGKAQASEREIIDLDHDSIVLPRSAATINLTPIRQHERACQHPQLHHLPNVAAREFRLCNTLRKESTSMQSLLRFQGFSRAQTAAPQLRASRQAQPISVCVRASSIAAPVPLPVRTADGATSEPASLALRVAEESAKGLVHRYLVLVRQNARQVKSAQQGHLEIWCQRTGSQRRPCRT